MSTSISFCKAPEVPNLIRFNDFFLSFIVLELKSIFTSASSSLITMSILSAIWTFNSFEIIWILTEGGPRGATTTLIIDTYKQALGNYKFGRGAARAVVVMILLTLFAGFYLALLVRINKKISHG